jgi:hypothetical protein
MGSRRNTGHTAYARRPGHPRRRTPERRTQEPCLTSRPRTSDIRRRSPTPPAQQHPTAPLPTIPVPFVTAIVARGATRRDQPGRSAPARSLGSLRSNRPSPLDRGAERSERALGRPFAPPRAMTAGQAADACTCVELSRIRRVVDGGTAPSSGRALALSFAASEAGVGRLRCPICLSIYLSIYLS